jgi:hypothetical protein
MAAAATQNLTKPTPKPQFYGLYKLRKKERHIPSLNTQSCIKGLLVVRDICFWADWTAGPVLKKSLGLIMSNF